jgi:general secretion pathway protein D
MRALLLATLLLAAPARAADEPTVALNFQDVELPVLAKFVSEVTGRNLIVDDRVRGKVTIISPTRITPDEAFAVFQSVLQVKGFTTVTSAAFTKIVPLRDARESAVPAGARAGEGFVTQLFTLRHAEVAALVPALQPLVSKDGLLAPYPPSNRLIVVDAAANVDRLASLLADLDAPPSERTVETLPLRFAAADELAGRLREALGTDAAGAPLLRVVAEPRTNHLVVAGPPADVDRARQVVARLDVPISPGAARTQVHRLRYANAEEMVRVLAQLLGLPVPPAPSRRARGSSFVRRAAAEGRGFDGEEHPLAPAAAEAPPPAATGTAARIPLEAPVRITADPATNALVVSATPQDWETLRGVIAELDVRRRQVFVEAIILEATVEKTRALGIEIGGTAELDGSSGLGQVNLGTLAGANADPTSLAGLVLAAVSNRLIRLPSGQEVPAHTLLLTALQTDGELNVLSAPTIVTTDNEEAEIVVGRNVPFIASRATSSSNLENLFTTIERFDVGITLRMTPQITADDFVRLTLFEEVSDLDPAAAGGDPTQVGPTTTVRSASTVIAAHDGQTVVIGGLLSDTIRGSERSVPYLGKIPVLGHLFRRDEDRRMKTNLLVFLTPHIIASDRQMAESSQRLRERMPRRLRETPLLEQPSWDPPAARSGS